MKELIKKIKIKIFGTLNRMFLHNKNFTIISNNCWGGFVYQKYNLPYSSPTIGLYFFADEYIKFLKNFPNIVGKELHFIDLEESKYKNKLVGSSNANLIIGKIDDVEIVFLHYKTKEEAVKKWNRRVKRINYDNLIIKMNDQNLFDDSNYDDFISLPFKNKLLFTTNSKYNDTCCVVFNKDKNDFVKDDIKAYKKYINITKYINGVEK